LDFLKRSKFQKPFKKANPSKNNMKDENCNPVVKIKKIRIKRNNHRKLYHFIDKKHKDSLFKRKKLENHHKG